MSFVLLFKQKLNRERRKDVDGEAATKAALYPQSGKP
jgi:hypothetical protein